MQLSTHQHLMLLHSSMHALSSTHEHSVSWAKFDSKFAGGGVHALQDAFMQHVDCSQCPWNSGGSSICCRVWHNQTA
jgi:hypothetical protein